MMSPKQCDLNYAKCQALCTIFESEFAILKFSLWFIAKESEAQRCSITSYGSIIARGSSADLGRPHELELHYVSVLVSVASLDVQHVFMFASQFNVLFLITP